MVRHVEKWAKVRGDKLAYRFVDFSTERDGVERDLNWADFSVRNRAVAARLQQVTQPGDRVAILCPQNLDYIVAFFGTLYAGRIAVPLFDPSEPGHVGRLHAVLDDCQPTAILTTTDSAEGVRKFFRSRPAKERPRVIAVDAVPDDVGVTWEHVDIATDTIAYLQYTSGSTRIPTGVQITHLNLATNVVQVIEALDGEEGDRGVTWLPFFHDMGLITALVAPMIGHYVTFMTPAAFVRRPGRWIREMARKPDDTGGVISVAPNFAFDHAAARGLPKDGEEPLDLSNVKAVLNGSEPISAATVRRFNEAFGPYGFKPVAIKPSYGLAEATLFVSTTPPGEPPKIVSVDRDELNTHRFVEVPDDSTELWLIWCIGNTPLWGTGPLEQYVHMIELSANGALIAELDQIADINARRATGEPVMGSTEPIVLHVVSPICRCPWIRISSPAASSAEALVAMGYHRRVEIPQQAICGGVPLDVTATQIRVAPLGCRISLRVRDRSPAAANGSSRPRSSRCPTSGHSSPTRPRASTSSAASTVRSGGTDRSSVARPR